MRTKKVLGTKSQRVVDNCVRNKKERWKKINNLKYLLEKVIFVAVSCSMPVMLRLLLSLLESLHLRFDFSFSFAFAGLVSLILVCNLALLRLCHKLDLHHLVPIFCKVFHFLMKKGWQQVIYLISCFSSGESFLIPLKLVHWALVGCLPLLQGGGKYSMSVAITSISLTDISTISPNVFTSWWNMYSFCCLKSQNASSQKMIEWG